MKISNIILSESVRRNNQRMNESFVIPYNNYLKTIAPAIKKINEAELTVDQINQIFSAAEQGATAGGDNRTLLGKGKDKAQDIINKILPAQKKAEFEQSLPPADAGPVQGFEQQAQQAIDQVEDPKAKKSLMDLVKQGIKNPVTQTLLMTAITGIAGVVAAPAIASLGLSGIAASTAIGAVVGGLSGVVKAKMGGADWKEAGKQGLKGAGMGAAAGAIGGTVATLGQQAMQAYQQHRQQQDTAGEVVQPVQPTQQDLKGAQLRLGQELPDGEKISALDSSNPNSAVTITKPDGSTYSVTRDTAYQMTGQQGISPQATGPVSQGASMDPMAGVSNTPASNGQTELTPAQSDRMTAATMRAGLGADTQGAAAPTGAFTEVTPQGGDVTDQLKNLVSQGYTVQRSQTDPSMISITDKSGNLMQQFNPGNPFLASRIASAANGINIRESIIDKRSTIQHWALNESLGRPRGNVQLTPYGVRLISEGVMDWVKTKGHNLTTKITADKLMQAWKKAGSPTDSAAVSKVLADAGVSQDVVSNVYSQLKIPVEPSTADAGDGRIEPTMGGTPLKVGKTIGKQPAQDPAVWKNNRNPDAPAGTSPADAAAKAGVGQPTDATPADGQPGTTTDQSKAETPPAPSKQDQIDADAHQWFNQRRVARNQSEVSFDDWKKNYRGKPMGPIVQPAQGVQTPAAPNFGTPPAQQPATAPAQSAPAGADKFIQQLIDGFNALTPEEKAEIQKELQTAMDASENQNIVKGVNEALRKQFAKLTLENIEWWVNSKAGRSSNKRIYEAALLEISYRKAKLKKRYQ